MKKTIEIKPALSSLDELLDRLKKATNLECTKSYDSWEVRTDANGNMEQCIVIKKNALHGIKIYFENKNALKISYIIPNKLMNAYFGKSQKSRRNIFEIVIGNIVQLALKSSQQKAFKEMEEVVKKASL